MIQADGAGVSRLRLSTELRARDRVVLRRVLRRSSSRLGSGSGDGPLRARLVLLGEVLFALDPRVDEFGADLQRLSATSGEVELLVDVEQPGGWRRIAVVEAEVEAPEELRRLRPALIETLDDLGPDLATDVLGQVGQVGDARRSDPLSLLVRLDRIEAFEQHLHVAAAGIRPVARTTQERVVERRRWRAGDNPKRVRDARLTTVELPGGGVAVRPDVLTAARTRASADVEEHRQFARGLRVLQRHARELRASANADLLVAESEVEHRIGGARRWIAMSPAEKKRFHGRVEQLRLARSRASLVVRRCQQLLDDERWLVGVGEPRTALAPTPTFQRVSGYSRAYEALRGLFDFDVAADAAPVDRFKTTPELFEVWVFVACARILCEVISPGSRGAVEVRLAELRRGDAIEIDWGARGQLLMIFEPVIEALQARTSGFDLPYRAALSTSALRPDVWIEWTGPEGRSRAVVIDAKCTARFRRQGRAGELSIGDELEHMRDYRSRVIDPLTGRQPVRAMFQVHYAAAEPIRCNVKQLLQGRAPSDAFITGAVGAAPGNDDSLRHVLQRLLQWLMQ
ncbi:MAG: hypothetical protein AAGG01_14580 [Planctomycetota bacterium]